MQVGALELVDPVVDDLLQLEEGVIMYDAYLQREVLVVAPVLCILADNSRSSELLNHMGSTANKYCRLCQVRNLPVLLCNNNSFYILQVNKQANPQAIGVERYKAQARTQMSIIDHQPSETKKKEKRTRFGLKEGYNPLLKLSFDPYKYV